MDGSLYIQTNKASLMHAVEAVNEQDPSEESSNAHRIQDTSRDEAYHALKEILSSSKTKSNLTSMFAQGLLKHIAKNSACKLVVVFGNNIKGQDFK